jgi:TonB family protein
VSIATIANGRRGDRRRVLASMAAAVLVHTGILTALALGIEIGGGTLATPQVTVDLQGSGADAFGTSGGPAAPTAPSRGHASDAGSFVIPAPRAQPAASTEAAGAGPSFREAGARTGTTQTISSAPSTVPAPSIAPQQQGKGNSGADPSGVSSVQRSGAGVLTSSSESVSSGSLDLGQLDGALAGRGTRRSGPAASAGSGDGSRGGGNGGQGRSGQGYSVIWSGADSGKGRMLIFPASPKLPAWVSAQGLTLSVSVNFILLSDGLIGGAAVQQSSGYADVDAAVVDAIRRWRFTPAEDAPPARGLIPYVIRAQ